jgi:hypothetical protein
MHGSYNVKPNTDHLTGNSVTPGSCRLKPLEIV